MFGMWEPPQPVTKSRTTPTTTTSTATTKSSKTRPLSIVLWTVNVVFVLIGFNVYGANQSLPSFTQLSSSSSLATTTSSTSTANYDPNVVAIHGLSLVTSFWAETIVDSEELVGGVKKKKKPHAHRREIEAALLLNLQNPHLRQVVVILDSINENTTDCPGFVQSMTRKLNNITQSSSLSPLFSSSSKKKRTNTTPTLPQLECIEHRRQQLSFSSSSSSSSSKSSTSSSQPTYFEMFHYATYHPTITSDKVILTNADQVFDETLVHAKNLSPNILWVLSTRGYYRHLVPPNIQRQYETLVGGFLGKNKKATGFCEPVAMQRSKSWDSYIFHRSLWRDTLQGKERFARVDFWRVSSDYYMNERGAENAALFDITRGVLGRITVWNACHLIRIWHFHLAAKMHHNGRWPAMTSADDIKYLFYEDFGKMMPKDGSSMKSNDTIPNTPTTRVPSPYLSAPYCTKRTSCHMQNPRTAIAPLHYSPSRQDASKVHAKK